MSRPSALISLADLAAAGVRLRPLEVVTIVRELALQVARGEAPGVPSAHVIRLSPSGAVFIEGPVAAGGRPVVRAAQLLETLLPAFDAPPQFRAPGGLRLVVARALGAVDLPRLATLDEFADALVRFAAPETAPIVRQLVASWAESVAAEHSGDHVDVDVVNADAHIGQTQALLESHAGAGGMPGLANELTVSDLRRARRATGLTLSQVAERSRIPVTLLRELEWGYLRNWPVGQYGRTELVRYARAAGLDEEVVVRTVWPLLEEGSRVLNLAGAPDAVPETVGDAEVATDESAINLPVLFTSALSDRERRQRRARVLALLAVPALLAIGVVPALWSLRHRETDLPPVISQMQSGSTAAAPDVAGSGQPKSEKRSTATAKVPDRLVPPVQGSSPPDLAIQRVASTEAEPVQGVSSAATGDSPSFSPVGSAIFHDAEAYGGGTLKPAAADEGAILRITRIVDDRAQNFHVRPSPDGSRIAFDSDRQGGRAVYIADADGRNVRRVTDESYAAVPSWSPDSRSLAFVRAEADRPRVLNLWMTDLASRESRRLTNHEVGQPSGSSWFPDGKRIAYGYQDRLIVLDVEPGTPRVYPSPRKGTLLRTPSVSPDGRRVIFQVHGDGAWLLELKDGSMRRVLADPSAEEYIWSPDGRRVAYYSSRSGEWRMWVMAPR